MLTTGALDPKTKFPKNPFGEVFSDFVDVFTSQVAGLTNVFDRVADYENAITKLSVSFGGGRSFAQEMRESMVNASVNVKAMGGDFDDMKEIIEGTNKAMGSTGIITSQGMESLYASLSLVSEGVDITAENAKSMVETFTKAGVSIYDIGSKVTTIFNEARVAGVNAKLVYDEVSKNLNQLNLFNFKNGVEGMAQMAASAQQLRINMSDTLKFADSLYDPEKAVEMASVFQRYGMGSLTNVYEMQDLARSDPKKLQEMLANEFSRFVEVNEETGERTINAYGQEIIRALQKENIGISADYIMQSGLAKAEMVDKREKIALPEWAQDEKLRDLLYSQAKMGKGGEYVISLGGMEREISSLTQAESERLKTQLQEQGTKSENEVELQRSGVHAMQQLHQTMAGFSQLIPEMIAANSKLSNSLDFMGKEFLKTLKGTTIKDLFGLEEKRSKGGVMRYETNPFMTKTASVSENLLGDLFKGVEGMFTKFQASVAAGTPMSALQIATELGAVLTNSIGKVVGQVAPSIGGTGVMGVVNSALAPFLSTFANYTNDPNAAAINPFLRNNPALLTPAPVATVGGSPISTVGSSPVMTGTISIKAPDPLKLEVTVNGEKGRFSELFEEPYKSQFTKMISESASQMGQKMFFSQNTQ
jgi:hypothetical protein